MLSIVHSSLTSYCVVRNFLQFFVVGMENEAQFLEHSVRLRRLPVAHLNSDSRFNDSGTS